MKMITMTMLSAAALTLGACSQRTQDAASQTANSAATDVDTATDNAGARLDSATDRAMSGLDNATQGAQADLSHALNSASEHVDNAKDSTGAALKRAGNDMQDDH